MVIRTEELKDVCSKVLTAVDSSALATITETLELVVKNQALYINVTNKEYYVQVKLPVIEEVEFHATINAVLFLKLISQTTTENVELLIKDNSMIVKGNGTYTFPLIYQDDHLLELPEIEIHNITNQFNIDSNILKSILNYNSKELNRGIATKPVQKLYYIDHQGAITFINGACVNSFNLTEDVKVLLNNRLVKLFKLFKDGDVAFTLGYDEVTPDVIQTKVRFANDTISLTAILSCDDTLLNSVPVKAIRARANDIYPYSISINRNVLSQALNRMLLFNSGTENSDDNYNQFEFFSDKVIIRDSNKANSESVDYTNTTVSSLVDSSYVAAFNLNNVKSVVDNFSEPYLNIHFGNEEAIVITQGNIKNVIPEYSEM